MANLINAGILPLTFANADDYDLLTEGSSLTLSDIQKGMIEGSITMTDTASGAKIQLVCNMTDRQRAIVMAGGLLNYTKEGGL